MRCLKGYSNTAIGLSAADIIIAILRNTQAIIPVSTLVQVEISMHVIAFDFQPKNILFMKESHLVSQLIFNITNFFPKIKKKEI